MRRLLDALVARRRGASFRRSGTNLDGVMGARKRPVARTRITQAQFIRSPGRTVDWPGPPPAEWYGRNPELYVD